MTGVPSPRRRRRSDSGVSGATEFAAVALLLGGVVAAVMASPAGDRLTCFAAQTIVLMESSGGTVCGVDVPETPLPVPGGGPAPAATDAAP